MDFYLVSLALGVVGLGAMAFSGLGEHGAGHGHAGHGAHGHSGHAGHAGHAGHGGHGNGHAANGGHSSHGSHGSHESQNLGSKALGLLSPRLLFSFFLGLGTAGELAKPFLSGPLLLLAAIAGGVVFERLVFTPLWNFMMKFASAPASTLESAVADEATAVTSFDANGQGIVSIELNGQIVQLLATLRKDDRLLGTGRIRAGQRVRVEEVDSEKNCCTVSLM